MLKLKCGLAIGLGMFLISGACGFGAEKTAVRADENETQEPVKIDESTFPDEVFRQYVSDNFDEDMDGSLSEVEIGNASDIYIYETLPVVSFQGVEYFSQLLEFSCSGITIEKLDLSQNHELTYVYCDNTSIQKLDLSGCPNLTSLVLQFSPIRELNLKNCSSLNELSCLEIKIDSLDLSDCVNLVNVSVSGSLLRSIDLSKSPRLRLLDCSGCSLRQLDLSSNVYLHELYCDDNASLKSLNVENCKYLTTLFCSHTKLKNLDLRGKEYLKILLAEECALETIDVTGCIRLEDFQFPTNPITSMDFSTLKNLVYTNFKETMLTEVDFSGLENLEDFYTFDTPVKKFSAKGCTRLKSIDLHTTEVKELDVSGCTSLSYLAVEGRLDSIDIRECSELTYLYVDQLGLRTLDLSHNPKLKEIWCFGNDLLELDVSMLPDLEELCCDMNHLKELDLTHNPKLSCLDASSNEITSIDLSKNKNLVSVDMGYNPIKNLDISKNPELLLVWVNTTELTSLDVSNNPKLININCSYSEFEELDIRKCPDMLDLVKNYPRRTSEDGEYYYYSEYDEENAIQNREPDALLYVPRFLGFPINTRLIVDDLSLTPTATPTPTISPIPTETPTPTPTPVTNVTIGDFVERLYTVALDRPSEQSGKAFWVDQITSGKKTGGDCGLFFLTSEEFTNRNLSIEDFVETLYKTFFGRESEASGKAYWVGVLKNGGDRTAVIKGFIDSKEWCNLCADYGVRSGAPNAKAEKASKSATMFASRLYTCCLGREPEDAGLKYWALALTNLEQTGCSAAKQFFTGAEFVNLKLKNEEYVKRLYLTFMGRDPEASEITYWAGEISKGAQTRESVLAFFGQSDEFSKLCVKYGIERGSI